MMLKAGNVFITPKSVLVPFTIPSQPPPHPVHSRATTVLISVTILVYNT